MSTIPATHSIDRDHRQIKRLSKRPRPSRDELRRCLQILAAIPAPLPPELPSPPASRSTSPAPTPAFAPASSSLNTANLPSSSKRKLDSLDLSISPSPPSSAPDSKRIKSHRHSPSSSSIPHASPAAHPSVPPSHAQAPSSSATPAPSSTSTLQSIQPPPASSSTSQTTDPSAQQPPSSVHSAALFPFMPVRRPRRDKLSPEDFEALYAKYHSLGRRFKYSGDARFRSNFPPSHKHYKPLSNPPPPGSPYHIHGTLMSRLELLEALIYFVYALWCQDFGKGKVNYANWTSLSEFLTWCRTKWEAKEGETVDAREKCFFGLIHMIEAFIHARKAHSWVRTQIERDMNELMKTLHQTTSARGSGAASARATGAGTQLTTPGMLPSPATASSANSTPTNPNNGTPDNRNSSSSSSSSSSTGPSSAMAVHGNGGSGAGTNTSVNALTSNAHGGHGHGGGAGLHAHAHAQTNGMGIPSIPAPPTTVPPPLPPLTISVQTTTVRNISELVKLQGRTAACMDVANALVTLPSLRTHFPRTFSRMVYSQLGSGDEGEVDMDDDEGELFWPGQAASGEGLAWVCLMARAMVREFGSSIGYVGEEGVVDKPDAGSAPTPMWVGGGGAQARATL